METGDGVGFVAESSGGANASLDAREMAALLAEIEVASRQDRRDAGSGGQFHQLGPREKTVTRGV